MQNYLTCSISSHISWPLLKPSSPSSAPLAAKKGNSWDLKAFQRCPPRGLSVPACSLSDAPARPFYHIFWPPSNILSRNRSILICNILRHHQRRRPVRKNEPWDRWTSWVLGWLVSLQFFWRFLYHFDLWGIYRSVKKNVPVFGELVLLSWSSWLVGIVDGEPWLFCYFEDQMFGELVLLLGKLGRWNGRQWTVSLGECRKSWRIKLATLCTAPCLILHTLKLLQPIYFF